MSGDEIRPIEAEELAAWSRAVDSAFGGTFRDEYVEVERMVAKPERYLAAFEGDRIVGGNASIGVELTVPGGARVPTCAVSGVGVVPGATRQGIATRLMRRQLDDAKERGEPLAVLHASEAAIYGRYGFGMATRSARVDVDRAKSAFVRGYEPRGRVRLTDRDEGLRVLIAAREALADRPGWVGPATRLAPWELRDIELDHDVPDAKDSPPFVAVHEGENGSPDGVAIYRVTHRWPEGMPRLEVTAHELAAADPQAHADLWRFLLDLDLVATVASWNVPVDDPLFRLVREPRCLQMRIRDGLYLAFVDLREGLEARGYAAEGRLTIAVDDPFCSWNTGTWELRVDAGASTCRRTDAEPELTLSATDLASTYLGDVTFAQLAAALRVRGTPESIAAGDALFASLPVPWCWIDI